MTRPERRRGRRLPLFAAALLLVLAAHAADLEPALVAAARAGDAAARASLRARAENGDGAAARLVADLAWLDGDPALARSAWRQAADAGDVDAAYNLGLVLLDVAGERPRALDFLARAAAQRHALACFALGTTLLEQGGDRALAAGHLACAAEQGYAPAQYNLARLLALDAAPGAAPSAARAWMARAAPAFTPAAAWLAAQPAVPAPEPVPAAVAAAQPATNEPAADPPGPSSTDATTARPAQPAQTAAATGGAVHGRAWLLAQPPQHYTLQVAAGESAAQAKAFIARHAPHDTGAVFLHRPAAREPYTAILGSFAERADAATRLAGLPPALARNAPWIRRLGTLQREVLEKHADE